MKNILLAAPLVNFSEASNTQNHTFGAAAAKEAMRAVMNFIGGKKLPGPEYGRWYVM